MTAQLPALPPLPDDLVARHIESSARWNTVCESVDEVAWNLFRFVQLRLLRESIANVSPIHSGQHVLVVPPRRRFLTPAHRGRMAGCYVAIRHLDARNTMRLMGHVENVIDHETPMVVHAMAESANPSHRETNPGLPRANPLKFHRAESRFEPPPGDSTRELLLAAVDVVNEAPVSYIARAGWFAVTMFAVHPFADGNGRTARLLFQAINSAGLPNRFDFATVEMWARHRGEYIELIKASQEMECYDGARIDALPFMCFSVECSIEASELCIARVGAFADFVSDRRGLGLSDEHIMVEGVVAADRNLELSDLDELQLEPALAHTALSALAAEGRIRCDPRRGWNLVEHNPFAESIVLD